MKTQIITEISRNSISESDLMKIASSEFNSLKLFFNLYNLSSIEIAEFINLLDLPDRVLVTDKSVQNATFILGVLKAKIFEETGKTLMMAVYPTLIHNENEVQHKIIYLLDNITTEEKK